MAKIHNLVIVGGGLTGLSTLHHAMKAGIGHCLLVSAAEYPATTLAGEVAAAYSVPHDLVTRFAHTWGERAAFEVLDFFRWSYDALHLFCDLSGIKITESSLQRVLLTSNEKREAGIALTHYQHQGVKSKLLKRKFSNSGPELEIFNADDRCFTFRPAHVLDSLRANCQANIRSGCVTQISRHQDGYELTLADGSVEIARFVVLANHLAAANLLDQSFWSKVLISTQEQSSLVSCKSKLSEGIIANYGHEHFTPISENRILINGARFLRHHAGVGFSAVAAESKITNHLTRRLADMLALSVNEISVEKTWVGLDCRPCDELPVIGPVFGENGLLIAAGFMGQGQTLGFNAGCKLVELITNGRAKELPRMFFPERLQTM